MICDSRCHAILDPSRTRGRSLGDMARAAVAGGATILQYRDKETPTRVMIERAREILAAIHGSKVPMVVNDRADVALAARAHGVHVGQEDMHPQDVRRLMGPDAIVGLTVKTPEHAAAVPTGLVDYVGIGAVYETASKHNPEPPIGLIGLTRLAERVRLKRPDLSVCAIAGITADNAAAVIAAGADGIAVISEIFMADDPAVATERLRAIVDAALAARRAEARA